MIYKAFNYFTRLLLIVVMLTSNAWADQRVVVSIAKYRNANNSSNSSPVVEVIRVLGANVQQSILSRDADGQWNLKIPNVNTNIDLNPELTAQRSSIFSSFEERADVSSKFLKLVPNRKENNVRCKAQNIDQGVLIACVEMDLAYPVPAKVVKVERRNEVPKIEKKVIAKQEPAKKILASNKSLVKPQVTDQTTLLKDKVQAGTKKVAVTSKAEEAKVLIGNRSTNQAPLQAVPKKVIEVKSQVRANNKEKETTRASIKSSFSNIKNIKLKDVQYLMDDDSRKVVLPFDNKPRYRFGKASEIHYRLVVDMAELQHDGLALPVFAPRNFRGISAVKAFQDDQRLLVDFRVDSPNINLEARVVKNSIHVQEVAE